MPAFATPPPYRPNRSSFWQDSFYYLDVSNLPVKADSSAITADILSFHQANFGDGVRFLPYGLQRWNTGSSSGYFVDSLPSNLDPAKQRVTWASNTSWLQQPGKHLYWSGLRQQGATRNFLGQYSAVTFGDRHAICYSESSNELLEVIGYSGYSAACIVATTYNLSSYNLPFAPNGTSPTGAIAPRIPVAPFFFTYQDLMDCGSDGDLGHMIGFVLKDYRNVRQWPSRQGDGTRSTGPKSGEVLRLSADFNLASLPNDWTRAIARTLQKHGMLLFDRSDFPRIVTCNDPLWPVNFDVTFKWDQFEAVDLSSVEGAANSIRLSITNAGNEVPVPSFTYSPQSGAFPLTVNFNASASTDPDGTIVSYAWNFGDGTSGTGVTASHTYTAPGTYSPTLTVTDNDGASSSVAASGWSPQYVLDTPPDKVRFGVSVDPSSTAKTKFEDPISKPLSMYRRFFSWNQAVNGNMRTELITNNTAGRSTWLSFKTPETTTTWRDVAAGTYQAQVDAFLVGLRDTGINTWLTPYHEPEDNAAGEAPGNGSVLSGTASEWRAMVRYIETRRKAVNATNVLIVPVLMAITFNSGTRDDADWMLLEADFPLYGIDPYTNDWATSPARLTSASFTAAVSALEAYGKDIAIAECGGAIGTTNARPVGLWAGFVQECLDHDIKACCWFDFGNNALNTSPADPSGTTYAAVLATFAGSSNYNLGRTASTSPTSGSISVTGTAPANVPPTAVATSAASSGVAPFATSFASSGSSDSDGTIVSRLWNFGDGTTSTAVNPSKTYTTPGTYVVTLTVTDDDGATGTSTRVVTVGQHRPTAVATANVSTGVAPLTVSFDATGSTDSRGYRITGYTWNFGDGTTATGAVATHTYTTAGTYTVTLTAISDDTA